MAFWRRYYASGMLKDGRIIIVGGEQDGDTIQDTNKGEIYDPVADTWTAIRRRPAGRSSATRRRAFSPTGG
jgi:hypothetical protein